MYHPLFSRSFGRLTDELEETFWGKFDEVHQSHEHGSVSSLQYSSDGILMSVWKHAIVLYSSNMNSVITKLSSDQGFHASHFRGDGKIFAVSEGPEGRLGIYTLGGRCIQRFKNQNDVVNCLEFSGKSHVVSWSGDGTITRSEVATGSLEHKFLEPDVSRGICSPFSENIIISGCSNGNVKIGDWRNCASMNIYNTKNQIYSATFISEDLIALGCAGDLHLVDLRMRLPLNVLRPHSKCISGLCTLSNRQHLTTVSYDRTFKVFDSTHGFNIIYTSSTATTGYTSVASNISNTEFSFGFEDGFVRRQRRSPENTRSKYVEIKDHSVTKPIDQCLKGYEHAKALKLAVKNQTENSKTLKCDVIFSLLQELIHRNAIRTALSGWNETELYALLNYLIPFCRHKSRTDIIVTVIELCLEVYAEAISLSTKIMRLLSVLRNDLEAHILNMSNMTTLESTLDVLIESNYLSV